MVGITKYPLLDFTHKYDNIGHFFDAIVNSIVDNSY
jgi:hypothetical protein